MRFAFHPTGGVELYCGNKLLLIRIPLAVHLNVMKFADYFGNSLNVLKKHPRHLLVSDNVAFTIIQL